MATPTVSWDETTPPDTRTTNPETLRSEGEERIRELKTQIRELIAVDHQMDYVASTSTQDTDWGWHNTLGLYAQSSNPSAVSNSSILFSRTLSGVTEAFFIDENGNAQQITQNGSWTGGMTGEIRMWFGTLSSIPNGWALCDGSGGRPNMIAKFCMGISTSTTEPGTSGGANTTSLDASTTMPSHTHTNSATSTHSHNIYAGQVDTPVTGVVARWGPKADAATVSGLIGQPDGAHAHTIASAGSGGTFSNMPAYYELAYIVKT